MLDGEQLKLKLTVEEAIPLEDGRWQLVVPELESLRLDEAIFGQVATGQSQQSQQGMLESPNRSPFFSQAFLLLDLLILEALLVVEDVPESSVFHIDTTMVDTQAAGSYATPAQAYRPSSINRIRIGVRLQGSLFPSASPSVCAIVTLICLTLPFFHQTG